jgi:xanthine/CO dehydrogenase XdhC/CoxF family maturation factor
LTTARVRTLVDFFERERRAGRALVAAFIIGTEGSTYRKCGALMLFSAGAERLGLLSGGCLESDLQDHALRLLASRERCTVRKYDSRGSDDPVWGLGLGCEGLMRVLLLKIDEHGGYEPLASLLRASESRQAAVTAIDVVSGEFEVCTTASNGRTASNARTASNGQTAAVLETVCAQRLAEGGARTAWIDTPHGRREIFSVAAEHAPTLLLCGAGPDADPVAEFAARLGWQVTVVDHRSAYVDPTRFPARCRVLEVDISRLGETVDLQHIDAAVVMSHHLTADGRYLAVLAKSSVAYIGLLGPAARRERLAAELGDIAARLRPRLYAPVGLDLGGRSPEAIALSIVAEIEAFLNGRRGAPFSASYQGSLSPV